MVFSLTACNPESPENGGEGSGAGTGLGQDNTPVVEGKWLVKDGETDYYILTPDTTSATVKSAAAELAYFFNQATGINLKTKTNSEYSADGKYISFGDTSAASTVTVTQEELGTQGFKIVTVGDNIVVKAFGEYGLLWGSYELLSRLFNYEFYAKDCIYIDTKVTDYPLKAYDITDVPDIEIRAVSDSQGYNDNETAHRMRQIKVYDEFLMPMHNQHHNSFYYVMDELDDKNNPIVPTRFLGTCLTQLCYMGHGDDEILNEMLDRAVNYLAEAMAQDPTKNDAVFGIQDENGWCSCETCERTIQQYGTSSSTMILFMNKLRERLDAYLEQNNIDRKINLYFFAYFEIVQPPVHKNDKGEYVANDPSLVCKDGVGVLFAPIYANYTQSIYSDANESTYEQFKAFKAITKSLHVWTYACNFIDFLAPFDSITYMPDWFKAIVENNGTYIFNQGRHSQGNSSSFDVLRQYLVSKLEWDINADVNALTNKFFDGYFGKAKAPMRRMYDELRTILRYNYDVLGMSNGIFAEVTKEEYWPEALLNGWMSLIDEAYELAGDDQVLRTRILRESIFVRYHLLKIYITDGDNVQELRDELIKDAIAVGIEKASEHKSVVQMFG